MQNPNSQENNSILETGRNVIDLEAKALTKLSAEFPINFPEAISLLFNCEGHIIISGVGKSGHIGKKISSTLSSTGSPSIFLHPAEASHGDLGLIKQSDILLIISHSGETVELANILSYAQKLSIKIVSVTAEPKSTLAKKANLVLNLPHVPEACPNGLAPTTSTTLVLALGDAIAVSLMKKRNFSQKDFSMFHPGGKLGAKLRKVKSIMHLNENLPLINHNTVMTEVLLIMTNKGFGVAGIINTSGELIGIITDGDLRRNMKNLLSLKAHQVMTDNPISIDEDTLASEALALMHSLKITSLFCYNVRSPRFPSGIVHVHDCLRVNLK